MDLDSQLSLPSTSSEASAKRFKPAKKIKLEHQTPVSKPSKKKRKQIEFVDVNYELPSTSTVKENLHQVTAEAAAAAKETRNESDEDDPLMPADLPDYAAKFGVEVVKVDQFKLAVPHINLQYVAVDEICLEGLDGITIEALWTRISIAVKQPLPFPKCIERYIWDIVRSRADVEFYQLVEPREKLVIYDRFQNSDPDFAAAIELLEPPLDIYPYQPIKEKDVLGSSANYNAREDISKPVRNLTLDEAESRYGARLVMVATQRMRTKALINSLTDPIIELTAPQYCLLERIGRSRRHGEVTQGKGSLQIISKDPKIIFYNRKILVENRLISKQAFFMKVTPTQHSTGSLLQLTRFHTKKKTKAQIMTEQIVDVLRKRPSCQMEHDEAKKVFGNIRALSKLFKLADFQRFIRTDVQYRYRDLYPYAAVKEWKHKGSDKERKIRTIQLINPQINIGGSWNEDEPKDESSDDEVTKQMIYNSPILHQVYDYIRLSGPNGRSLKEIQSNKGLDFYSVRAAVNQLLNRNLVVGVKIDLGRQRIMKYHIVCLDNSEAEQKHNVESFMLEQKLEEEALDFLSDLLEVDVGLLKPAPNIQELEDNSVEPKSKSTSVKGNYAIIKQLREQNRLGKPQTKEKNVGYKSKAGESLLCQLLSHKDKLNFETTNVVSEEAQSVVEGVNIATIDTHVERNISSSRLEKLFKNQHGYDIEKNVCSVPVDSTLNLDSNLTNMKDVCRDICHSSETAELALMKNKRKTKKRRRLFSKIKQRNVDLQNQPSPTLDLLQNSVCPLKFTSNNLTQSPDYRYHKLCNKALKIVKPILSRFKYKIKILAPKKRYMCRERMSRATLMKFSQDHPMLKSDIPVLRKTIQQHSSMFDLLSFDASDFKRKMDSGVDNEDAKRLRLDDTAAIEPVNIYMGPNPTVVHHEVDEDNIEITVLVSSKPEEFDERDYKYIKDSNVSLRTLKRATCVVEAVRQEKIIMDVVRLHKMIQTQDNEEGYNVKVDKKTIERLYTRLVKAGHIKVLQIILKSNEIRRSVIVICDPSLDIQHSIVESVLEQLKMRFFITARKRDWEIEPPKPPPAETEATAFDTSEISSSVGELKLLSSKDSPYLYNRSIGKDYGHSPKFMRMRVLHEFLYHLIYNYSYGQKVYDVKEMLNEFDVEVGDDVIRDMPRVYCRDFSWKMFVPPLPKHTGWSDGWALVCDILLRLPLSLFVKLYNVSFVIPELPAYLEHPVKQFYLVKHLPMDIRNGLLHRRKYIFSIHETLTRLCYIGILQFGPQKLREKDQLFIFLNRRATLLDTTTSNAGYHYVEDKEYKKLDYYFSTATDVETYWYEMWNICAHSKLGLRNTVTGTYITIEQVDTKPAMLLAMKPKDPESAPKADDGHVPGDKRGAAGLDSALWSHIKRNWIWCSHAVKWNSGLDSSPLETASTTRKKHLGKLGGEAKKGKSGQVKAGRASGAKSGENPLKPVTQSHRRTYKKANVFPTKGKKQLQVKQGKKLIRKVLPRVDMKKKRDYDIIDRKLMENLKQSRSEWHEGEDRVLHICKIIAAFLCPNSRKQVIVFTVIRDVLHKLSPCSTNKTSGACQRRVNVIFGPSEHHEFLQQIVKSLNRTPYVIKYFQKFCDKIEAGRVIPDKQLHGIFVYLVTYFYKRQHEIHHILEAIAYKYQFETNVRKTKHKDDWKSDVAESSSTCHSSVPEDFAPPEIIAYDCTEITNGKTKTSKLYVESSDYPQTDGEIQLDTVKSIIHSTIGSRQDEITWIYQLFRVYQNYPDDMLKAALTEIRNSQMISIKRAYMRKYNEAEGLPITSKLFQFSYYYYFTQITKFPPQLFLQAHEIFLGVAHHDEGLMGSSSNGLPMECFEQGHSVGLGEIATIVKTHFNVDIPKEVLLLNPNIADHTELIKELSVRYKKMLTLVKEGTYFKDDENDDNVSADKVAQHEKAKCIPRTPMIQRFLKSWFLADETDEADEPTIIASQSEPVEDVLPRGSLEETTKGNVGKKVDVERRHALKPDIRKRKRFNQMTSEESKKILQSLNPRLYAGKADDPSDKGAKPPTSKPSNIQNRTELLNSINENNLSFEDYEKKLESLLVEKNVEPDDVPATPVSVEESQKDFESIDDAQDSFTDFSDNDTNILEKYLCSKRHSSLTEAGVTETTKPSQVSQDQDVVGFALTGTTNINLLQELTDVNQQDLNKNSLVKPNQAKTSENVDSDPVTNARIQYLMNDELTVEQIMQQMLVECPSEERKVPKPINLARLLVKGLFPELDEDEERLERLHQHFVIICPDTQLLWSDLKENEDFNYLSMQHSQTCKRLLRKVQMDIIISDSYLENREFVTTLKSLGGTDFDIGIADSLIDFVLRKRAVGASAKQLKEKFSQLEKLKLSTILQTLTNMNILIRAGVSYIVFVHHKYRKSWLVESCSLGDQDRLKLKETQVDESSDVDLPTLAKSLETFRSYTEIKLRIMPWARIDGTLNLKIFEKWMSTVLGYCLSDAMTPLMSIIRFCCYLKPVEVYYLVECLEELGCVRMLSHKVDKPTLFSSVVYEKPVLAELTDAFEDICVETNSSAVIKFGTLLNKKMKEFEFPADEAKKHGTF